MSKLVYVFDSAILCNQSSKNVKFRISHFAVSHISCSLLTDRPVVAMASSEESSGRKAEKFMKKAERLKCYSARDAYWKCLDGFEEYAKSGNINKEIPQEVVAHIVLNISSHNLSSWTFGCTT